MKQKKSIIIILWFVTGVLLGSVGTLLVLKANTKAETPQITEKNLLQIEPLFADSMDVCRTFGKYFRQTLPYTEYNQMYIVATTAAFFGEVELYLRSNKYLQELPDDKKADFVKRYQKWLKEYEYKIQQPPDGELSGPSAMPIYPSRRDELIQEFLNTIPDRNKTPPQWIYQM